MSSYARLSGAFFTLLALAHVVRLICRIPIRVGDVDVPVWVSVIPVIVSGALAIWAFRVASGATRSARPDAP